MRAIQFQNKRVGSTFLQKAIDSHPDIVGIDEVFVNMARKKGMRKSGFVPYLRTNFTDPIKYLNNVVYKKYPDTNTIFKLMYNQIDYHSGLSQYIKNSNMPIIHLMRRNLVKQVLSGMNAATMKHDPIVVAPLELFNTVREADNLNKVLSKKWKEQIRLTLYYEDIIGESVDGKTYVDHKTNVFICDMFQVTYMPMYATTKKKNKDDISTYLPNYEEIKKMFKETIYSWMIEK